jgi:hypothetical protein
MLINQLNLSVDIILAYEKTLLYSHVSVENTGMTTTFLIKFLSGEWVVVYMYAYVTDIDSVIFRLDFGTVCNYDDVVFPFFIWNCM